MAIIFWQTKITHQIYILSHGEKSVEQEKIYNDVLPIANRFELHTIYRLDFVIFSY